MIRVTNIKRCRIEEYDEIYLIVRSIASLEKSKSSILKHAEQLADLSPSKKLFYEYLNWSKAGVWNQTMFDTQYKPAFEAELANNANVRPILDMLKASDAAGKKIALLCFCTDERLCHRSIIGEILRNEGCNVVFDRDTKRGVI